MTKLSAVVTWSALAPLAAPAAAQNLVATSDPASPEAPTVHYVDARLGVLLGAAEVGDTDAFSPGISGSVGYRYGELLVHALGDYYRVGDDPHAAMARRGRATHLGAAARYAFAHTDYTSPVDMEFWGELGGGYEHVAWLAGGVLDRPTAEVAFGFDGGHRGKPSAVRPRQIGYFMAFRAFVAEAPPVAGAMATCGGPCSSATTPSRTDVTMFFELGVQWGR